MKMYFIKKETCVIKPPPWKRLKYHGYEPQQAAGYYTLRCAGLFNLPITIRFAFGIGVSRINLQTPEIKFFDTHFPTNRNLETNVKGIFVAGDGTGKSRGIVGAGISGIIAAHGIAEKYFNSGP